MACDRAVTHLGFILIHHVYIILRFYKRKNIKRLEVYIWSKFRTFKLYFIVQNNKSKMLLNVLYNMQSVALEHRKYWGSESMDWEREGCGSQSSHNCGVARQELSSTFSRPIPVMSQNIRKCLQHHIILKTINSINIV